jgi:probable phosphoglycerate mutase
MKAILYTDGGASPSESYASWIIFNERLEPVTPIFKALLPNGTTNNEAEYHAVIQGLQYAQSKGYQLIEIRLDSKLVINQLTGEWHVRNPNLLPLHHRASKLRGNIQLTHVDSKSNQADPKGKTKYVQSFEAIDMPKTGVHQLENNDYRVSSETHPIDEILKQFSEDYKKAPPERQKKAMALLVEAVNILNSKDVNSSGWV